MHTLIAGRLYIYKVQLSQIKDIYKEYLKEFSILDALAIVNFT